jgi:magnesium transporter
MIAILKGEWSELKNLDELAPGTWVNVVDPDAGEISRLQQELQVPRDFLTSALDLDEKSRIDREGDVQLISLRIPFYQGQSSDIPFITIPLGIILTDDLIVTVCKLNSDILSELAAGQVSGWSTEHKTRVLLKLLLRIATKYLRHLRQVDKEIDVLEDKLQLSMKNQELMDLLKYQKSLTYFTTALKSNELIMERLQKSRLFRMRPEDEDLLEDVLTENQQAIEMVNISANILSQMMDAFASIISNNLNVVMKFLTSATIILMMPTLVASLYGMNVSLPLQKSPYAFVLTLFMSFLLSLMLVLFFLKKKWF